MNDNLDIFGDDDVNIDDLQKYLSDQSNNTVIENFHNWPKATADIFAVFKRYLNDQPIDKDKITGCAAGLVMELAKLFGGRMCYLPRNHKLVNALRYNKIYHEFTGNNHQELADKYDVTIVWIYKIIKEQHQLISKKLQLDIFSSSSD